MGSSSIEMCLIGIVFNGSCQKAFYFILRFQGTDSTCYNSGGTAHSKLYKSVFCHIVVMTCSPVPDVPMLSISTSLPTKQITWDIIH